MSCRVASPMTADIEAFLAYKRGMGRQYLTVPRILHLFDQFVATHCAGGRRLRLDELIQQWLARSAGRARTTVQTELSYLRQLCRFLRRRDPRVYVPGSELVLPDAYRFKPYVFSRDEMRRLLRAADTTEDRGRPMIPGYRACLVRTLLLVLYCTGIRSGEVDRLQISDVDMRRRLLFIRPTKRKSRWVPFHGALAAALRAYLTFRRQIAPTSDTSPFFVQSNGHDVAGLKRLWFKDLVRRAGIEVPRGRRSLRPYELRHTFAVHRLTRWYRERRDLSERLPWLSTYMGHENLMGTEVYLTATPELLQIASRRFEARFRRKERS